MAQADARPIRILHVVGRMRRAGAETILMHLMRHADRERFRMDFMVHSGVPGDYDNEIRALGGRCFVCPEPSRPLEYARNFNRILRDHGPYDVVHSHVHHFSGYVVRLARQAGVPVRIVHSHNDMSSREAAVSLARRVYLTMCRRWVKRYATSGLAVSGDAARDLFGATWECDVRWKVIRPGIDARPFREPVTPAAVRAELSIPTDALVIGHVGRFEDQKNHGFLMEIAAEIVKREQRARFLLVGDGDLRCEIENHALELGIRETVIFAGVRPDVPRLMLGAMHAFLFPSLHEGLGLVLVEAQAAGLPCVLSDVVPAEADVIPALMTRLSLDRPASEWADAVMGSLSARGTFSPRDALAQIESKGWTAEAAAREWEGCYSECCSA